MMHNTCSSYGSILSLRRRHFGFISCNYPNERCPSICCCNCCSQFNVNASRLMPISLNRSLLYGFKQSCLIQCPPSRRVVLGSNDWYCYRSSIYHVGCSCCCCCCGGSCSFSEGVVGISCMEKCCDGMKKSVGDDTNLGRGFQESCCVNEKKSNGVDEIRGRIFKGKRDCRYNVRGVGVKESNGNGNGVDKIRGDDVLIKLSKDKRDSRCNALGVGIGERKGKGNSVDKTRGRMTRHERDFRCDALGDAEAMLSLLNEEGMEERLLARERKKSSCKDTRIKEQNVSSKKCMDVKVSSSALSGSGYLESKYRKKRVESSRICFKEDSHEKRNKRESALIDGDQRLRRRESCSSYYSRSDSSEFGSESEIDVKEKRVVGESSTSQGKDLRKMGGVIISEVSQDDLKSYEDEKNQQLISSRRDNVKVGSSSEWDWTKKSEKKLTDDYSSEVSESMKESIMRQSKLCQVNESSSMMASSSNKQIINQRNEFTLDLSSRRKSRSNIRKDDTVSEHATMDLEFQEHSKSHFKSDNQFSEVLISCSQHEQSTSGTSCLEQLNSQISDDKQESSYLKSSQQQESSSDKNRQIVETAKTTLRRPIEEKVETVVPHSVQETECEYCRTCRKSVKENIIKFDVQQHSELSDIRSDAKWTTSVQSQSESGHNKQEMDASSFEAIVEDSHRDELHLTTENVDTRRIYGQYEMSDSDFSYDQSTLAEMRMTNLKGNSQDVKKLQEGSGGRFIEETESNKLLRSGMEASQVSPASVEINCHTVRDKQIYKQQTYVTSNSKVVKELVEKHDMVDKIRAQQVGEVEAESDLQLVVMPPSYLLLQHSPSETDLASNIVRESSRRATGVDPDSGYYSKAQARTPIFTEDFSSEDAINSAQHMQDSSTQIVGEFIDKMSHESSASGTRTEKESSQLDKIYTLTGFTQSQAEKFSKQDSSPISGGSGTSVGETSQLESSESAVSRRTGKSMRNIVSGIFRLQWGSSESRTSPIKSSKKSSSNDSANNETWFSGNEQYDGIDDRASRKQIGTLQEPSSPNQTAIGTVTSSQQEDHKKDEQITITQGPTSERPIYRKGASRSQKKDCSKKEKNNSREPSLDQSPPRVSNISKKGDSESASLDILSSPIALHVGLESDGVSIRENTDLNMAQRSSVSSTLGSSTTSASQFKRSNVFEEIEEVEKIEAHISSSPQDLLVPYARRLSRSDDFEESEERGRNEEVISSIGEFKGTSEVTQSDIPTSEETDAELKRRKLQRSKQVMPDRYDDWEDAYKRENEQRKVDEIFMREALGEAIKAGGSWEVPVGAVLVQNGKIIARGYNLVEELRDSTAHAEMICIREGSNILRTWRLSETTLYVTLEPCPMCAGAILHARIQTLVWGAPNKLLGADGSWIRLFSKGVEGDQRLEVADKPAAPAHPFHPKMNIRRGILESECAQIMQQFFQLRRKTDREKEKLSEEAGQPSCLPGSHKRTKLLRIIHGVFTSRSS